MLHELEPVEFFLRISDLKADVGSQECTNELHELEGMADGCGKGRDQHVAVNGFAVLWMEDGEGSYDHGSPTETKVFQLLMDDSGKGLYQSPP